MIKTIFGNSILNETCSRVLHGNSTILKHTIVLVMLVLSMLIILFELTLNKSNPKNWNIYIRLNKQKNAINPINKLA